MVGETDTLLEITHNILKSPSFVQTAKAIFYACRDLIGAQSGYVALLSADGEENEVLFLESGGLPCSVDPNLPMPIRGLRERAYKNGQPVFENDFMKSRWATFMPKGHVVLDNVMFAPLVIDHRAEGVMGFANKRGDFDENDTALAAAFGNLAAIALRKGRDLDVIAAQEQRLQKAHDHLEQLVEARTAALQMANARLRESEKRYRTVIDTVAEGILLLAPSGKITGWNKAAEEIFGIPESAVLGKAFAEVNWPAVHEDGSSLPLHEHPTMVTLKTGTPCSDVVLGLRRESGDHRWVSVNTRSICDPAADCPESVVMTFRDVTAAMKAECERKKQEAFERTVSDISATFVSEAFDNMDAAIDRALEAIGRITESDRAYVFMFHRDQGVADNTHEWCAEGVAPQIENLQGIVLKEALPWFSEQMLSGAVFYVPDVTGLPAAAEREKKHFLDQDITSLIVVPVKSEGVVTGFLGFDSVREKRLWSDFDRNALKRVGDTISFWLEKKKNHLALMQSEEKYRSLVDEITEGVAVTIDGKNHLVNNAFAQIFGYTKAEMIGRSVDFVIVPEEVSKLKQRMNNRLQGKTVPARYETKARRKDGAVIEISVSAKLTKFEGRQAIQIVISDITEQKKIEEKKRQSYKMQSLGTLAGGIAHEFNNILGGMMGYAEIVRDEACQDSLSGDHLDRILNLGSRARDLIRQILLFSRKSEVHTKLCRPHRIIREQLKMLRNIVPSSIDITADIDEHSGTVLADETQLQQIGINLCNNAVQAMQEKGGVLRITLSPVCLDAKNAEGLPNIKPGEYVKLTVCDTGTGIAPEIIGKIYDPFFTTKGVGEGTGMGLSVVHGILESFGGGITVESAVGRGTTFTVLLPRAQQAAEDRSTADCLPTGTERILVVDDEDFMVLPVKGILERLGYAVTAKTCSLETLELFKKDPQQYDLLITDLTMPHMTGDRLAAEVTAVRPDMPVILTTGYADAVDNDRFKQSGITAFISKPFRKHDLAETVRRALDKN